MKTVHYKKKLWHLPFAITNAILYRADPGAGTPPASDWRANLPDDIKAHPTLATFKDVNELAKSHVNAQTLLGSKRIALPPPNASEAQLAEFYTAIGRPESHEKYSEGTVKLADGITLDKAGFGKARETFHKLGLTDAQQKGIMDFYLGGLNEQHGAILKDLETSKAKTDEALRAEWGAKFDANYDTVKAVVKQFGNEEFAKEIIDTQLGNNPGLVRMLLKVGSLLQEDKSTQNKFNIAPQSAGAALARKNELTADVEFQRVLNDKSAPGHDDAVELWTQVHRQIGG